jgi:hypothetical protein
MGMKHEAKKGTIIRAGGVTITVLRGNPQLEITTDEPNVVITVTDPDPTSEEWGNRSPRATVPSFSV